MESFGDIVFGFAVSQCALQLPLVRGRVELSDPLSLMLYFVTFAVLASLWLIYHRVMSGTYKPTGIDLLIPFAFLALASLVPFALYQIAHNETEDSARSAMFSYLGLYAPMSGLAAILALRNLRRGYFFLTPEERDRAWLIVLRQGVLCVMMAIGLVLNSVWGPSIGGPFLILIFPAIRIARKRFWRAPAAERLRLQPNTAAG